MIIFLTDKQQAEISRDLSNAWVVLTDIAIMRDLFQALTLTGPEYRMSRAHGELVGALRSIAKTMQDAAEISSVEQVNQRLGETA